MQEMMTRSPTFRLVTEEPTSVIVPTPSWPRYPALGHGGNIPLEDMEIGAADRGGVHLDDHVAGILDLRVGDVRPGISLRDRRRRGLSCVLLDSEDGRRIHDAEPAGRHGGVDAGRHDRLAGMFVELLNGIGRHAGMGEVHHDFVPGKLGCQASADHIEGSDVRRRDDAAHVDPRRLLYGVDPDEHFDLGITV